MSLPRYPSYKDSGVEWLGEVPGHWVIAKTVRYFKVAMGQTILREDLIDDGEWPVFSATDGDHYFGRVNEPQVRLAVGDIVIPARGNSIGAVKLVKEPSTTTQTTIYCKNLSSGKLNPSFVFHFMKGCKDNLFYFTQTAIPQITVDEVGSNPILIPPISEQTQIAAFLDRETAKIDELVAEQRRLMELLKEKRQAVISHAVTQGLNPDAPMKPSGIEWLGDVPAHWEVKRYKNALRIFQGMAFKSSDYVDYSATLSVRMGNIKKGGSIDLEHNTKYLPDGFSETFKEYALKENDLIIAMTDMSPSLEFLAVPAIMKNLDPGQTYLLNQRVGKLVVSENFNSEFIKYLLLSDGLRDQLKFLGLGTVQSNMSSEDLYCAFFVAPSLNEQTTIVTFLDNESLNLNTLTAEAQRAIDLLQERRTALISAAVTGQIDVRTLPASHGTMLK